MTIAINYRTNNQFSNIHKKKTLTLNFIIRLSRLPGHLFGTIVTIHIVSPFIGISPMVVPIIENHDLFNSCTPPHAFAN